ncbi:MAG TPA: septal ring lytic transglycosylase RlpA family protein [Flavipsychrobacter sp.]
MRLLLLTMTLLLTTMGVKAQQSQLEKLDKAIDNVKKGIASFYHDKFEGRRTATGDIFDNDKFTAASNKLKLGSYVKVTNVSNGEVVYVKINDRMAKSNTRLIDLASVAAKKLDFHNKGIAKVKVEVVPAEEGKTGILAQNKMMNATDAPTKNEL